MCLWSLVEVLRRDKYARMGYSRLHDLAAVLELLVLLAFLVEIPGDLQCVDEGGLGRAVLLELHQSLAIVAEQVVAHGVLVPRDLGDG